MKEELSSEKMTEETKEAIDVDQRLTASDSNEDKVSFISIFNELQVRMMRTPNWLFESGTATFQWEVPISHSKTYSSLLMNMPFWKVVKRHRQLGTWVS